MYLFPTQKELNRLSQSLNPNIRVLSSFFSRGPAPGSMAEFFLDSEDIDLVAEDDCMSYFDEIEDDIIEMRRDINGFRTPQIQDDEQTHPPAPCEKVRWEDI